MCLGWVRFAGAGGGLGGWGLLDGRLLEDLRELGLVVHCHLCPFHSEGLMWRLA